MSDEACGLWIEIWMSILVEELPRLGRALASIGALERDYLTDSERQHLRDASESAMRLSPAPLETAQFVDETEPYPNAGECGAHARGYQASSSRN
jgi:hypothetical protein